MSKIIIQTKKTVALITSSHVVLTCHNPIFHNQSTMVLITAQIISNLSPFINCQKFGLHIAPSPFDVHHGTRVFVFMFDP